MASEDSGLPHFTVHLSRHRSHARSSRHFTESDGHGVFNSFQRVQGSV